MLSKSAVTSAYAEARSCGWFSFVILLAMALAGCKRETQRASGGARSAGDRYVVFIEADFRLDRASPAWPCYAQKRERLAAALRPIVDTLFRRVVRARSAGRDISVEFDAVNGTRSRIGGSEGWLSTNGPMYGPQLLRQQNRAFRDVQDSLDLVLTSGHETGLHDLFNTINFLRSSRSTLFNPAMTHRTVVIYLDDLVHYNAGVDTDAKSGRFNLSDTFSLRQFVDNVQHQQLSSPTDTLVNLAGEVPFAVYSVRIPRCPEEPWPGGVTPNFDASSESVQSAWEGVFTQLGANPVQLGLGQVPDVFANEPAPDAVGP